MVRASRLRDGKISKGRGMFTVALTETAGTFLLLCLLRICKGNCRHYQISWKCGDAGDPLMDAGTGFYT